MRMPDVLREIAIREEIRDALLGKVSALRDISEMVLHDEPGDWEEIGSAAIRLGMKRRCCSRVVLGIRGPGAANSVGEDRGRIEACVSHTERVFRWRGAMSG